MDLYSTSAPHNHRIKHKASAGDLLPHWISRQRPQAPSNSFLARAWMRHARRNRHISKRGRRSIMIFDDTTSGQTGPPGAGMILLTTVIPAGIMWR